MRVRRIFFFETGLAAAFAAMSVLTCVLPDWIERLLDASPDNATGEAEWGLAAGFGIVTLVCTALGGFEWRRAEQQASEAGNV
jgi:hypothetical protein